MINFYYNKKLFKVFAISHEVGNKIVIKPACFDISRNLIEIEKIRKEIEL